MEYKGKLYGRLGHKQYFDTSHTTDDWDNMVIRIAELEKENQVLRQPHVIESVCEHEETYQKVRFGVTLTKCVKCRKIL